jgi:PAS domain S-box-containing protein
MGAMGIPAGTLAGVLRRLSDLVPAGLGRGGRDRSRELATQEALRDSEERLRLVRRATGLGMYEIDWIARRRYWSPELRAILRVPADLDINSDGDLLERIIPDDQRGAFRSKLHASLSPDSGGDYDDEHRITRFDGTTGWILLRGKTFFADGAKGKHATRSIGLIVDITDRKRGEEANALLASTVLSSNDAIFSIDTHRTIKTWNDGARRLYGYSASEAIGRPLLMLCPQERQDEMVDLYAKTAVSGEPVMLETLRCHKDGRLIPVGISGAPIRGSDGRIVGVAAVHRDMTERRDYEEHMAFTMRELSHRTKNLLAVVQGLAHMIGRRSEDVEEFQSRFGGCLQALAYCHDLLVQHDWQGATLEELLRVQLAPFTGSADGRVIVRGPPVHLTPQSMQSVGLTVHELATNATKHGALSNETGSIAIAWHGAPGEPVRLTWRESGGPPVRAPSRKGFGQVVFERIGATLDGGIETDFRPDGLVCEMTIGASNLRSGERRAPQPAGQGGVVHHQSVRP